MWNVTSMFRVGSKWSIPLAMNIKVKNEWIIHWNMWFNLNESYRWYNWSNFTPYPHNVILYWPITVHFLVVLATIFVEKLANSVVLFYILASKMENHGTLSLSTPSGSFGEAKSHASPHVIDIGFAIVKSQVPQLN